ncbi:Hypothetical_protein [Hexamita inflata]|uniref:Hypothetical_protein n=1 Tax=Hexamita inflata TaxID=28002 RepID=A0AA86UWG3_9EUKA|nr:Hypothetical protein HINF_LOCUS38913 [Hexamita inflata]
MVQILESNKRAKILQVEFQLINVNKRQILVRHLVWEDKGQKVSCVFTFIYIIFNHSTEKFTIYTKIQNNIDVHRLNFEKVSTRKLKEYERFGLAFDIRAEEALLKYQLCLV